MADKLDEKVFKLERCKIIRVADVPVMFNSQ